MRKFLIITQIQLLKKSITMIIECLMQISNSKLFLRFTPFSINIIILVSNQITVSENKLAANNGEKRHCQTKFSKNLDFKYASIKRLIGNPHSIPI